jgi:hypothetical protein
LRFQHRQVAVRNAAVVHVKQAAGGGVDARLR